MPFRLAVLAACAAVSVAAVAYAVSEARLERTYAVEPAALVVRSDAASLERGRHLVRVVGQCTACHGDDLAGQKLADDAWIGRLYASNLTPGEGGLRDHTTADLVRSIRHGVKRDGRSVRMMPSHYLSRLSDTDLAAIIAYLRALSPVDGAVPPERVGPLARLALSLGRAPGLLPAGLIEDAGAPPGAPPPGPTAEYGSYLVDAGGCRVCHRDDLSGGLHPLSLPGEPPPSDLTPSGPTAEWSERDFISALRTGATPDGRRLDPEFMPWRSLSKLTDLELRAIWRYLRSLPRART